jgi:hypothetical protein
VLSTRSPSVSELVKEISNVIVVQHLDLAMDAADYVYVSNGAPNDSQLPRLHAPRGHARQHRLAYVGT